MWDAIVQALSGAGDWLGGLLGSGATDAAATYGADAATSSLGSSLASIPWSSVIGTGLQGAGLGMQAYNAYNAFNAPSPTKVPSDMSWGGGQGQMTPMPPMSGVQSQMQSGGVTQDQMRRRMSDAQTRGLSGASPDFLATMAGVTPEELQKMLGYNQS